MQKRLFVELIGVTSHAINIGRKLSSRVGKRSRKSKQASYGMTREKNERRQFEDFFA